MNYDGAREIVGEDGKPSGRWRYTRMNDGQIWSIGHCADSCPGHATAEEAREHYKQSLLDGMKILDKQTEWPKEKCRVPECDREATRLANLGPWHWFEVCPDHANRDDIAGLFQIGESAHS